MICHHCGKQKWQHTTPPMPLCKCDERDPTEGLPDDLAAVLRDQSVIVPQDAAVFEQIAKWRNAPSNTASADLSRWDHAAWLQARLGEARARIAELETALADIVCWHGQYGQQWREVESNEWTAVRARKALESSE